MDFSKTGKQSTADFIREYQNSFSEKIPKNTSISDLAFVVIDTETTGPDPDRDALLSFAGITVNHLIISVSGSLELIINKASMESNEAIPVHEITTKDISQGMDENEATKKILAFLSGKIAVGFNINFDKRVISRLLKNNFRSKFVNPVIEINDLAKRVDQPVSRIFPDRHQNLKDLCEQFNIPLEDHHTAGGDAFATAQLFLKILSKLKKRGVNTWGKLKK